MAKGQNNVFVFKEQLLNELLRLLSVHNECEIKRLRKYFLELRV